MWGGQGVVRGQIMEGLRALKWEDISEMQFYIMVRNTVSVSKFPKFKC